MNDSEAIALLCALLRETGGAAPLTPAKWADLAEAVAGAGLDGPASLAEMKQEDIVERLALSLEETARVRALLERGGQLAVELERLANMGVWILTLADDDYPERLRSYLGRQAPPVLFGAGERSLLTGGGLAIVGSRSVDEAGNVFARDVAAACAAQGIAVMSGGARGVDSLAMGAEFKKGGAVVGVLADSLEREIAKGQTRAAITERRMALITPYHPSAPFSVGLAMGRNKLIYALADWALVVRADLDKGGSWGGATEALKAGKTPVFVRDSEEAGPGNAELLRLGAAPFPAPPWDDLAHSLNGAIPPRKPDENKRRKKGELVQPKFL